PISTESCLQKLKLSRESHLLLSPQACPFSVQAPACLLASRDNQSLIPACALTQVSQWSLQVISAHSESRSKRAAASQNRTLREGCPLSSSMKPSQESISRRWILWRSASRSRS